MSLQKTPRQARSVRIIGVVGGAFVAAILGLGLMTPVAGASRIGFGLHPTASSSRTLGGCQISGTAKFTPGLTIKSKTVRYSFTGKFTNCVSNNSKIKSGKVTASGKGTESCSHGKTTGIAQIRWNNGKTSTIKISTTGAANAVAVSGKVTKGTAFKGDSANAVLAFTTSKAAACASTGIKSAPFSGAGSIY